MLVSIALGIALGLSLAIVAVALAPAWLMRRGSFAFVVVRGRRDTFFWDGLAAALAITLGLIIALALNG